MKKKLSPKGKQAVRNKHRGKEFEREIVDHINLFSPHLQAKRAWGSNGNALGEHETVDIVVQSPSQKMDAHGELIIVQRYQAKRCKKLAKKLIPNEFVDGVVFKQDRGETLIILPFEKYLEML